MEVTIVTGGRRKRPRLPDRDTETYTAILSVSVLSVNN
jgi:hypothetical protein